MCTINIGGANVCFINSHLSAHENQQKIRKLVRLTFAIL